MVEVIQLSFADEEILREKEKTAIYEVPKGVMIWLNRGRGILQEDLWADRLGRKVRGLTGFEARHPVGLYFDGLYWTISEGTIFGTYASNVKKRVINK